MVRKSFTLEQVINKLREAEVHTVKGLKGTKTAV